MNRCSIKVYIIYDFLAHLERKYSSKNLPRRKKQTEIRTYKCGHSIILQKDVRFQFNKHGFGGKKSRAFSFWLNTDYIEGDRILLKRFVKLYA